VLFLALFSGLTLDAVRYRHSLFHRLSSVYFSLNVLAERGFACRFGQRHDYLFLPVGVGFMFVVVRITCGLGVFAGDGLTFGIGFVFDIGSGIGLGFDAKRAPAPFISCISRSDTAPIPLPCGEAARVALIGVLVAGFGVAGLFGRPPLAFVVPSRAKISIARRARAGSRLAIAARSEAIVPAL
jgi:hypothetical protein